MVWRVFLCIPVVFFALSAAPGWVTTPARAGERAPESDLETLTYGDLYVAQSGPEVSRRVDVLASYGLGLGVPQYTLQSAVLGLDYWVSENASLGVRGAAYRATTSELQTLLEERLGASGVTLSYSHPVRSLHARVAYSPLRGLVNFFGSSVVDYSLVLGAGFGMTELAQPESRVPSIAVFAEQKIQLFSSGGIAISYSYLGERHSLGAGSEWLGRSQMETGIYARF